ncbi:MAG: ATP-dependent zinc metalloprotease FtsH [Candidatus Sungbacteria bacterium]|nr:ATP-dependent zinc metalloprotease FtsH [Candidatus Sungbacteria bacterium]
MRQFSKQFVYVLLVFLILSGVYALLANPFKAKQEIPLSELVRQINAGEIKKLIVQDNEIEATKTDDTLQISRKESEAGITETLKNYNVDAEKLKAVELDVKGTGALGIWLSVILPIAGPVLLIVFFIWFSARQLRQGGMQAFSFGQSRARIISPDDTKERVMFKDVAGAKEAKEELVEIVDFLKSPKKFFDIGARIPRGVLLMGAPGTGKTLLARAVAGEAGVPFFHLSGSEFVEMFVGVGAARVRDLFKMVKKAAPAIIFIDEIDAVGRHRGTGLGGGHDEREQTLNQILVEMDGFETQESVIVMAATNRPDVLDPALLRPGRFDRRVTLDLPDINDREAILTIHAKNKRLMADVMLRKIAERTPGFSGADLSNLVNEAAILAARANRTSITQLDLINSIEKVLLGPERKSHLLSQKEKEISAYHEAGHALVAASLPEADPVHKISIVARGRAAGYTLKLPTEDKHLFSKPHFLAELAVLLGGYAAELLVFKQLTTGPHNDLEKATDLARALVTKYGMSDKIGPMSFSEPPELTFLGKDLSSAKNYSEATAQIIDIEVRDILNAALKHAKDIITKRRNILTKLAKKLIEQETIEQEEFNALVAA